MPELPDIVAYVEALQRRTVGHVLENVRIRGPFVVRSVDPPMSAAAGHMVTGVRRMGKRIVIGLDGDLSLVIHLMIAGRFLWKAKGAPLTNRISLAAFDFATGSLVLTEAGTTKRASIHLVQGTRRTARVRPGRPRSIRGDARRVRRATPRRKSHAEAVAHRPTSIQRNWQRVFRRDSPSRPLVPRPADQEDERR